MKKSWMALCLVLALWASLLAGCNTPGQTLSGDAEYTVSVVGGDGQPYTTGVIVQILKDGEQVALQPINAEGKVSKTLPRADYTVELKFTDGDEGYYYDKTQLVLSAQQTTLEVKVFPTASGTPVKVYYNSEEYDAYNVNRGVSYVGLTDGQRNFFLFAAQTSGTYRFTTSDPNATIGIYGYTHYIQTDSIVAVTENVITMSISDGEVGTQGMQNPFVIGVDAKGVEGCLLTIERIGDPESTIEDVPRVVYEATVPLSKYTLPEGAKLKEFDLTAKTSDYKLVFHEGDGFYHLNSVDGPLVLMRLGKPSVYLDSFEKITSETGIKKYFYNEAGEVAKCEDYTRCIKDYVAVDDDQEGLYPLTKDLEYILKSHGEYVGWWDADSPSFIFEDDNGGKLVGLNTEIAWLFACCYLEQ